MVLKKVTYICIITTVLLVTACNKKEPQIAENKSQKDTNEVVKEEKPRDYDISIKEFIGYGVEAKTKYFNSLNHSGKIKLLIEFFPGARFMDPPYTILYFKENGDIEVVEDDVTTMATWKIEKEKMKFMKDNNGPFPYNDRIEKYEFVRASSGSRSFILEFANGNSENGMSLNYDYHVKENE